MSPVSFSSSLFPPSSSCFVTSFFRYSSSRRKLTASKSETFCKPKFLPVMKSGAQADSSLRYLVKVLLIRNLTGGRGGGVAVHGRSQVGERWKLVDSPSPMEAER